jgi:Protein of unknown function (DUF3140)
VAPQGRGVGRMTPPDVSSLRYTLRAHPGLGTVPPHTCFADEVKQIRIGRMDENERKEIRDKFRAVVNMTSAELTRWLGTDESRRVGFVRDGEHEAVGHKSGKHIIDIRDRSVSDLDDEDYAHMRKVVGYVHRHLAQRPKGDVTETRWRYSLMNWGHNPLKD